jgi:hypothetical protein
MLRGALSFIASGLGYLLRSRMYIDLSRHGVGIEVKMR